MSKPILTPVQRGKLIYYSLDMLARLEKSVGFDEWGICEYQNLVWADQEVFIEGKSVLRVPYLDILDKRDERYSDWGDEEVLVFAGFRDSGEFTWFLLTTEEFKQKKEWSN